MNKLLLIDGNSLMFRAYYSTAYGGRLMQRKDGFVTNALHGFINMMNKLEKDFEYTHILVAFDAGKKTFRHDLLESYKDGRAAMPDDFRAQIPLIKQYLDLMNVKRHQVDSFEADDIIGTFAQMGCDESFEKIDVITGDKDLLQLVNDCVTVHITRKGVTELESYTPVEILEKYETTPDKMVDLKGMMGDNSDNLPGIPGIGEKTAIKLLKKFGSLEELLARTDELKGKQKEKVEAYKEQALLCKEMATIKCDMSDVPEMVELKVQPKNEGALRDFFVEMEFNSFLRTLHASMETEHVATEINLVTVTDVTLLNETSFQDCVLHVEIFEANYHQSTIVGFGIMDETACYYVPFDIAKQSQSFLDFLSSESIKKQVFDVKRATVALLWQGIVLKGVVSDILLKAYVLNPTTADTEFAKVALHYDYEHVFYDEQVYGKGVKRAIPELKVVAEHVAKVVAAIHVLDPLMTQQLQETDQWALYQEMELPLAFILAEMEFTGMTVDGEVLVAMGKELKRRIGILEAHIQTLAGVRFNVGSPKQLGLVLFEKMGLPGKKTKTGVYSTNADVLEKLRGRHVIIEEILVYRTLTKLYSTYIEGLQKARFPDGKVHTIFNQALTQTGRLSSTDPNVQNIPIRLEEGRLIRKAFVPSCEDRVLIGADYSQIELRILAHMSQTESLIEAFNQGEDVHRKTAAEVFKVPLEEVTEDQRRGAKAINFGIVYGQSAFGLSESLGISMYKAKKYIEGYLKTYAGIQTYMDATIKGAAETGYVQTLFNRRRYIPEINNKSFMVRQMAERTAINAPVQGSAADIMKVAMIEVDKRMKARGVKSKMVLQVHDELLFDVPKDEIQLMMEMVQTAMEHTTELSVPLSVEISSGKSWYETK
ncbi:MAG: DNA polymerase I [Defluviitaleaceae bacterium]|nr:DNA polymerase I [Defluviitaleaceae bacterium]